MESDGQHSCVWAHPRSRGDHQVLLDGLPAATGSSPLARGPPGAPRWSAGGDGLIPARAGTTSLSLWPCRGLGAHPRSRGDHVPWLILLLYTRGSSPLARGPLAGLAGVGVAVGLIPARAGTTWSDAGPVAGAWAHPRSRGDHKWPRQFCRGHLGSSPLARGPLHKLHARDGLAGLIPARAGTTGRDIEDAADVWAHPRSRGDHTQ